MDKIKTIINKEFFKDYSTFDRCFMLVMLLVQLVVFVLYPESIISMIAGVSGIISVVLCAKGKISFYFIGFIQTFSYLYLAYQNKFYGEVIENIFYLITMAYGIYYWNKNTIIDESGVAHVNALKFTKKQWIGAIALTIICTIGMGYWLKSIGSNQAYTDACTNVLAIFAQLLMVRRYREQWLWWIVIDVLCIKMWIVAGNWSMVAMYIAWTANALYGWRNWTQLNERGIDNG